MDTVCDVFQCWSLELNLIQGPGIALVWVFLPKKDKAVLVFINIFAEKMFQAVRISK